MTLRASTLWRDFAAATGLLTRVPLPVNWDLAGPRGAKAAWAYPLAGLWPAVIGGGLGMAAAGLGALPTIAAALAMVAQGFVTGALHEDGLADCVDGFWGGWTRERRLEIMKDSRIGAYGVLSLVLICLLRWSALTALLTTPLALTGLIAAALASRAAMVVVMGTLPQARPGGLSAKTGRPGSPQQAIALAIAAAVALGLCGLGTGVVLLITTAGAATAVALIARAKIGGQTGDVLGATQIVSETAVLAVLASVAG